MSVFIDFGVRMMQKMLLAPCVRVCGFHITLELRALVPPKHNTPYASLLGSKAACKSTHFSQRRPSLIAGKKQICAGVERCWSTSKDERIHQTTNTILMVAPVGFKTNAETAQDNYFMHRLSLTPDEIEQKVRVQSVCVVAVVCVCVCVCVCVRLRRHILALSLFTRDEMSKRREAFLQSVCLTSIFSVDASSAAVVCGWFILHVLSPKALFVRSPELLGELSGRLRRSHPTFGPQTQHDRPSSSSPRRT